LTYLIERAYVARAMVS